MKVDIFNIGGTICTNSKSSYYDSGSLIDRIKMINKLYESRNTIIFQTARGTRSSSNNLLLLLKMEWIYCFAVKSLAGLILQNIFWKPAEDIYDDNKGRKDIEFFINFPQKLISVLP